MKLNIEISDVNLLKKTIQILSCVIHGHNIRALLRHDTKFFSKETKADLIALYIKKEDGHKIDFISDKKRLFCRLMEKYNFNKYSPSFGKVGEDIMKGFSFYKPYQQTNDLHMFMKGTVTKKKCKQMHDEIQFSQAFFFPLETINGEKIGFVAYFYTQAKGVDLEKLREVSVLMQRVIEPLYDSKTATFYSKCSHVDTDMSRLTEKEKEIVHRVLKGITYKEIAKELKISINTLKTHMKNIFNKYEVSSKAELSNKLLMHMK